MADFEVSEEIVKNLKNIDLDCRSLVDVTDIFDKFKSDLKQEHSTRIFKSSLFDLFNSTSALEVNCPNLDSSLIVAESGSLYNTSLSTDALKMLFDLSSSNETSFVLFDYIMRSFNNWIKDNGSLCTNLISIKYIEEILSEYTTTLKIKTTFNSGDWIVDDLLRFFILSLLFIIKILSLNCTLNDYIREEEDIRFDSLGLNFMSEHTFQQDIKDKYRSCIDKLEFLPLKSLCNFTYCLADFLTTNMTTNSFENEVVLLEPLVDAFETLQHHRKDASDYIGTAKIPTNLKTTLPQRTYANGFPLKKITKLPINNYGILENIIEIFKSSNHLLSKENSLLGYQLTEQIYYIFTDQFQYYYDDRKLDNSTGKINALNKIFFLTRFVNADMSAINNVKIMKHITEDIKSVLFINEETEQILLSDDQLMQGPMALELQSLYQVYTEALLSNLRNQCQHRQSFSKQLLYWDSAQANIAQFEDPYSVDLASNLDKFPAISLWIYHQKLNSMAEFLLRGFSLSIYSEWEYFAIYWNAYNITSENVSLLGQFLNYNQLLLQRYETQNLNKNLKKKHKDASKRQRIKERNHGYIEQLSKKIHNLQLKIRETEIISLLCFSQVFRYVQLLVKSENKDKVLKFLKEDSSSYMYEVRFKAFESIGSPQLQKNSIGSVILSFIKDKKVDDYLHSALTKLKKLQLDLDSKYNQVPKKKDYWLRINNTIDHFLNVYLEENEESFVYTGAPDFFKIDFEVDAEKNRHEFFPTILKNSI
ncbi:hypothetical protein QEN19_001629 [Hanseniaspora menglaensis]